MNIDQSMFADLLRDPQVQAHLYRILADMEDFEELYRTIWAIGMMINEETTPAKKASLSITHATLVGAYFRARLKYPNADAPFLNVRAEMIRSIQMVAVS